jgi:SAM-dependent methyltransferase
VFEHIPDPETAEREVIRILKPGGVYCFTVPLHPRADEDIVLARSRADGTTEHLAPPTYHGDPLRPEGVLVYRIFSVPAMTNRFARLGAKCRTYRLWSKHFGLLGPDCFIHIVTKDA